MEYFRDHLTKSLKATKQSVEAIAEDGLLRGPTEIGPFERAPHFIKEGQMGGRGGGKNSAPTTTVNIFCSKRKRLSQQQPNFTSSYDKL